VSTFAEGAITVDDLPREALEAARALLVRACPYDPVGEVAEEKLFGPSPSPANAPAPVKNVTLGAWAGDKLVGVSAQAGRWLRLIAVEPDARERGVGHALLDEVISRARVAGVHKLRVGDQPGNYVAPGVDERNAVLLEWLEKRGFQWWGGNANLRVPLVDNPLVTAARADEQAAAIAAHGFELRRARREDAPALLELAGEFLPSWAFEAEAALLQNDPPAVHVAVQRESGRLAAFAAHDGNNRGLGWFGPAGARPEYRGKGLGAALLVRCLLDVAATGAEHAIIAWIGPREFYERQVGALDDRMFVVMERPL
jgi:GNAT superfamily N-acetyltransferase